MTGYTLISCLIMFIAVEVMNSMNAKSERFLKTLRGKEEPKEEPKDEAR